MFNSGGMNIKLLQAIKCGVILSVLLPSVSVFAQSPGTSVNHSMQATQANQFSTTQRTVSAYNSNSRIRSFRKASTVDLSKTKKVTKDDFGRLLRTVRQPKSTGTIWLGQQSRTHKPPTPKTTWLGRKGRSD